ncbi:MAG TPA: DUF6785 family protein [Chthonomonadaceae bacterium]|nr:DUF6785 family protein [Chthonomonadaceae bacterium]
MSVVPRPMTQEPESDTPEITAAPLPGRRALAAMAFGVVYILLVALAVRYTEMVTGRYVSHGVPPLPAFAAILLLSLLRPVLRRFAPRLTPSHGQMLLVYAMVATATILMGAYHIRAFLPHLVAMQYWSKDTPALAEYAKYLPSWLVPHDAEAIRRYYESDRNGVIPWSVWIPPLFWWSLFLLAIFLGAFSLITLIQRRWIREERLTFPLLAIPLAVSSDDWSSYGGTAGRRRALFLLGLAIPALFNGLNILHVLVPSVPSPGFYQSFHDYFPDRPWQPFGQVYIFYMLEAIGIGYFVPLEISFSVWFFYLLNRLMAVAGSAAGYDEPGFPFTQEQAAGGYIAMGLLLLWGLRRALARSLKRAFGSLAATSDTAQERWAWIGLVGSTLFILGFCQVAGFSLYLAVPYFAIIGLFVLVFARIRAETGVPFGFIYPYSLPKEMLLNTISISRALSWGGTGSFVLFSSLAWLSRHHLPEEHAAYQLDGVKLAEAGRIPYRTMFGALLLAFVVGLVASYWVHLSAYYAIGSNLAGGGTGTGEYRSIVALQEYQQMASRISSPPNPQLSRTFATFGGFAFVCILTALRTHLLRMPLHPLGFLIATAYGDSGTAWFPLGIAWACKATILRIGGLKMYRQGIPFFLGIAIGHFFIAGIFWPVLSLFITREASQGYHLYFGG